MSHSTLSLASTLLTLSLLSYPYGQNFLGSLSGGYPATTVADQTALDTNKNGILDAGDDAFSPYYPGDQYVDWIGVSLCTRLFSV